MALVVPLATLTWGVTPAGADVGGDHLTRGGIEAGGSLDFYNYGDATPVSVPADTGWTNGTYANSVSDDVPNTLTIDHYGTDLPDPGEPWWNDAWRSRRCLDLDHTAGGASTVSEYQVKVVLDTATPIAAGEFDADAQDLRAERHDGVGFVDLDLWVEPESLNSLSTVVWVQVDQIAAAANTDFCLYWNNPAAVGSVSDEAAVFTYTSAKTIYYTVSDAYAGVADVVAATPYVDGTTITPSVGGATTADRGDVVSFIGNDADTSYDVTGPIAAVGAADGQDSLVPVAFAGTEFVVPTVRDGQVFAVRSPWADSNVAVYDGTTFVSAATVGPAAGTVVLTGDTNGSEAAVVRSTNGVPFLLTYHSDTVGIGDSIVAVPSSTQDLFGVQSQYARLGYGGSGADAVIDRSDGTQSTVGGDEDNGSTFGPSNPDGDGPAARVAGLDTASGAVQQDDGDGGESSMFWPQSELGSEYLVPVDTQHLTVACPVAGTQISFGGSAPVSCAGVDFSGDFIGHAYDNTPWTILADAIGVVATGGEPFWLSFDRGAGTGAEDESQVGGMRQGRQFTYPAPLLSARPEEGSYRSSGLWDSAPIDTGVDGVYGLLRWAASTPAGTSVALQLATGPTQLDSVLSPFVGPDGTAGTYFTSSGTPAAYLHDFDRWARIRVYLATTDPRVTPAVSAVTLDTQLQQFADALDTPSPVAVASPAGDPTRTWVARVRTSTANMAGSTSTIRSGGAPVIPNLDSAQVSFASPNSLQVEVLAESVTQPVGSPVAFESGAPHSIVLDTTASGSTTFGVTWATLVGGSSPVIEHRFRFDLTG